MTSSQAWIQANLLASYGSLLFSALNIISIIVLLIIGMVQKDDLNYYLFNPDTDYVLDENGRQILDQNRQPTFKKFMHWRKSPIVFLALAVANFIVLQFPVLGVWTYIICLILTGVDFFWTVDYKNYLANLIADSAYLTWSWVIIFETTLNWVTILIFIVTSLATSGIGI